MRRRDAGVGRRTRVVEDQASVAVELPQAGQHALLAAALARCAAVNIELAPLGHLAELNPDVIFVPTDMLLTSATIDHRIAKVIQVAACLPNPRVH